MLKCKKIIQYCTKLLHNMYTKILTLFCEVIPEHHGIASERPKKKKKYKSWLSPSRGDLLFLFHLHNRPVLD